MCYPSIIHYKILYVYQLSTMVAKSGKKRKVNVGYSRLQLITKDRRNVAPTPVCGGAVNIIKILDSSSLECQV